MYISTAGRLKVQNWILHLSNELHLIIINIMTLYWYTKIFVLETSESNEVILVQFLKSVECILQQSICWYCEFLQVDGQNLSAKVCRDLPSKRLFDWTPTAKKIKNKKNDFFNQYYNHFIYFIFTGELIYTCSSNKIIIIVWSTT